MYFKITNMKMDIKKIQHIKNLYPYLKMLEIQTTIVFTDGQKYILYKFHKKKWEKCLPVTLHCIDR